MSRTGVNVNSLKRTFDSNEYKVDRYEVIIDITQNMTAQNEMLLNFQNVDILNA